jgi:TM2 domain-containing membrane protein YozV
MALTERDSTHSIPLGYLLWIFGFTGSHRFYYGKSFTGIVYFLTFGLFFIGWIVDFFLIPRMERESNRRYTLGSYDYSIAWLLLTFLGIFGVHRFYLGKWITGIIWMLTGGGFLIGYLYDFLNLNEMVSERNLLK